MAVTDSDLAALKAELQGEIAAGDAAITGGLDILWLLLGAYLVFFMQLGFAMLEAGAVRSKNTRNILLKNVLDACLGGLIWWGVGYSFAYGEGGDEPNQFIGGTNFFMYDSTRTVGGGFWAGWMFQWAFAAAAATIVSGAVAERCKFEGYLVYTSVITGFIYPVVVHWGWSAEGWLSAFRSTDSDYVYDPKLGANGFIDFAGSGIVHMTGGGAALMGAIILGAREGRFPISVESNKKFEPHSVPMMVMGTFVLWFGWYGFNPVSTLAFSLMEIAEKVAVTTTIGAFSGGLTVLLLSVLASGGVVDVCPALNGILAGLVSLTAPCVVVEPWAAMIIGIVGGIVYFGSSAGLKAFGIDDPLDASPVHFFSGAWGVVSVGFFASEYNTKTAYGTSGDDYGCLLGGGGKQLGIQLLGTLVIALWTCGTSAIMFFILKKVNLFRISKEEEELGMDESHHGGSAYNMSETKTTSVAMQPVGTAL